MGPSSTDRQDLHAGPVHGAPQPVAVFQESWHPLPWHRVPCLGWAPFSRVWGPGHPGNLRWPELRVVISVCWGEQPTGGKLLSFRERSACGEPRPFGPPVPWARSQQLALLTQKTDGSTAEAMAPPRPPVPTPSHQFLDLTAFILAPRPAALPPSGPWPPNPPPNAKLEAVLSPSRCSVCPAFHPRPGHEHTWVPAPLSAHPVHSLSSRLVSPWLLFP